MDPEEDRRHLTAFCGAAYDTIVSTVLLHGFYVACIMFCCVLLYKFVGMINAFPVKERAPRIAILQAASFLSVMIMIYFVELGILFGALDWSESTKESQIPMGRRIFKSFYLAGRCNLYIIYLVR